MGIEFDDKKVSAWHADVSFAGLSAEEKDQLDARVTDIRNHLNWNKTACYKAIFMAGIEAYEKEMLEEKDGKLGEDALLMRRVKEMNVKSAPKRQLRKLYESNGVGEVEWARENGITEMEEVVNEFSISLESSPKRWDDDAEEWLRKLFKNGARKTSDVMSLAIECGIIGDNPVDKARLRQLGSRRGFTTSEYAVWDSPDRTSR